MSTPARKVFSVSAVVERADQVIREKAPPLWVRGEVSGWKRVRSGHCYFTLKDQRAELCCVLWDRTARLLPTLPSDGMEVDVFGQLTIFSRRGQFQMEAMEIASTGIGGLWQLAKERLVQQLRGEGLLDEDRKRSLPDFPERVGIVTSVGSAVLHDMHRTLRRKAWWIPVSVSTCAVEGAGASPEIAAAIRRFGATRAACPVDVVIVARGGGSMESLWAFNLEPVARAIAECPVPVISAVGHETDYTVADMVADFRAPTPTAGAERAVPDGRQIAARLGELPGELHLRLTRASERAHAEVDVRSEVIGRGFGRRLALAETGLTAAERHLDARSPRRMLAQAEEDTTNLAAALDEAMRRRLRTGAERLATAEDHLGSRSPRRALARAEEETEARASALRESIGRRLREHEQRLTTGAETIHSAIGTRLHAREGALAGAADALDARSPLRVLARGYALLTDADGGVPIRSARQVSPEQRLRVQLADGEIAVRVEPESPTSPHDVPPT